VKTHVHFVVPGDIKSPQKHSSSQNVVQHCKRNVFLHFHGNMFIFFITLLMFPVLYIKAHTS